MADTNKNVNINIKINGTKEVASGLDKIGGQAEQASSKITESFKTLGNEAKLGADKAQTSFVGSLAAITIAAGTVTAAFSYMKDSVMEFANAQESVAKLNNVLQLTGKYSETSSQSIIKFATALERTSNFTAEQIQDQISLAIQFGKTQDEAEYLVKAAANLSTTLGQDLGTSMTQLLGSLNGVIPRFAKMSPELKNLGEKAAIAGDFVKFFHDKSVDSSASTETLNGKLNQLGNRYGDVKEAIGGALLSGGEFNSVLTTSITVLENVAEFIEDNATLIKVLAGAFAGVGLVIAGVIASAAAPFILMAAGISASTAIITGALAAIAGGTATYFATAKKDTNEFQESIDDLAEAEENLAFQQRQRTNYNKEYLDPQIEKSQIIIEQLKQQISLHRKIAESNTLPLMLENTGKNLTTLNSQLDSMFNKFQNISGNPNSGNTVIDSTRTEAPVKTKTPATDAEKKAAEDARKRSEALIAEQQFSQELLETQSKYYIDLGAIQAQYAEADDEKRLELQGQELELAQAFELQKLEIANEALTTKNDITLSANEAYLTNKVASDQLEIAQEQLKQNNLTAINKKANDARVNSDKMYQDAKTKVIRQGFELAAAIAKDGSKEQFLIQKAAAVAEIIIADGKARVSALAGVAPLGLAAPAAYAGLSALITASTTLGLATVAASTLKGFANGGIFNAGGTSIQGDNNVARLDDREMILNMQQQRNVFDAINSGSLGNGLMNTVLLDIRDILSNQRMSVDLDGEKLNKKLTEIDDRRLAY